MINFNLGDLPDSCWAPLSAISMAVCIITNLAGMFNKIRTFFS